MIDIKSIYIDEVEVGEFCVYRCDEANYSFSLFRVNSKEIAEDIGRKLASIFSVKFYIGKPNDLISEGRGKEVFCSGKLYITKTLSDECGLYLEIPSGDRRLLFASDDPDEIIGYAPRIGKVLELSVEVNDIDVSFLKRKKTKSTETESTETESGGSKVAKSKKVNKMKLCRELLANGTPDEEIVKQLVAIHLEEGKDKEFAEKRAGVVLKYLKRQTKPKQTKKETKKEVTEQNKEAILETPSNDEEPVADVNTTENTTEEEVTEE